MLRGQAELVSRREPIRDVLARPDVEARLKARLERALDARRFAIEALALPETGSYTQYADLGRPYALWNVFAAPEFSVRPREWCHLLVGCLAYRGYYDEARAREEARALAREGFDVHVAGVPAYSTLGWFDDPLLNTVLGGDDAIAGTIFHELAHERVFVRDDTAFSESYASFVEEEGLRRYFRDAPTLAAAAARATRREREFVGLVLKTRAELEALYASGRPPEQLREGKALAFDRLRASYRELKRAWDGDDRYDGAMAGEWNNARVAPFGLYHQWLPAFAALFARVGSDWRAFHAEVERLRDLPPEERHAALAALGAS